MAFPQPTIAIELTAMGKIGFDSSGGHPWDDREQDEATEDEEGEGPGPFWSR